MGRIRHTPRPQRKGRFTPLGGPPDMAEVTVSVPKDSIGLVRRYARHLTRYRPAQRDEVLYALRRHLAPLQSRYGVRSLALFGSIARNQARQESDVDLLVEFEDGRPSGMLEFVALKTWLEGILGRPVDLITPANIKPRIRDIILKEALRVL